MIKRRQGESVAARTTENQSHELRLMIITHNVMICLLAWVFYRATATLYTLVASAERHGIDPQRYLTGILARIASTPTSQLEQFLPERWNVVT